MDRNLPNRAKDARQTGSFMLPRELPADITYAEFVSIAARGGVHPLDLMQAVAP